MYTEFEVLKVKVRIVFLGTVGYSQYLSALRVAANHLTKIGNAISGVSVTERIDACGNYSLQSHS